MPAKPSEPAKVMDVTHPRNAQPDTTSRPVIVTNRPMIAADPMIAQSAVEVLTKSGTETEKPAELATHTPELVLEYNVDEKSETANKASQTDTATDTSQPNTIGQTASADLAVSSAPLVDRSAAKSAPTPVAEITEPVKETSTVDGSKGVDVQKQILKSEPAQLSEPDNSRLTVAESETDELAEDDNDEPQTTEQKQQANIEKLIASGLYAVPIGKVAKRRARILLLVLFIILLAFVTLDLLLDMGILDIPAIPHTDFFSI